MNFLSTIILLCLSIVTVSASCQTKTTEINKSCNTLMALSEIISSHENPSLKYYSSLDLKVRLAGLIGSFLPNEETSQVSLKTIQNIYEKEDFRLIAFYLNSLHSNDELFQSMFYNNNICKDDVFWHYFHNYNKNNPMNVVFVDTVSDVFQKNPDIFVYISNNNHKDLFLNLLQRTNGQLGDYIDFNFDLPGRSSLVRRGLIKKMFYKNHVIISKRNNPDKKGRFINEQKNVEQLKDLFGFKEDTDWLEVKDSQNGSIKLKLLSPFAIFSSGDSSKFYSLTFFQTGQSLEEVILDEKDPIKRKQYLKDMRILLDFLYQKGVIWGDMSPRNILVEEIEGEIFYTILDFEKTIILDRPILMHEREEHARGPMCVEEFGAICSQEEVTEAFSPYFNPAKWDLCSTEDIPFKNPKGEILSLLKERGITEPTYGDYNTLEKEMLEIRFFQNFSQDENYASLISVGFKIFHYLGSVYDTKTTEILLHAQKHKMMLPVVSLLDHLLKVFENKLILSDFEKVVLGCPLTLEEKQNTELDLVARAIDSLYREKDSASQMSIVLNEYCNILNTCYFSLDTN